MNNGECKEGISPALDQPSKTFSGAAHTASQNMSHAPPHIDFCTLGMFILDDIYPAPSHTNQEPNRGVIGGAGTFSALGARLLSPGALSKSVAWIVDAGTDFPTATKSELDLWKISLQWRQRGPKELTTRGWNGYREDGVREFKYLTPKLRLTPRDLTPEVLLETRSFHFICSPNRCVEMVEDLHSLRYQAEKQAALTPRSTAAASSSKPMIIWEPVPDTCIPGNLPALISALARVDVLSPNHNELAALFAPAVTSTTDPTSPSTAAAEKRTIEDQTHSLLNQACTTNPHLTILVRAGAEGVYIATRTLTRWLPAYHQDPTKIIDPTGAGNAFLGGFAVGLVRSDKDVVEAARWGSVAAGFCCEQVGVPTLSFRNGEERWNGVCVFERLEEFRSRTS